MNERTFGRGFQSVYGKGRLTLGINFPIEAYSSPVPSILHQVSVTWKSEQGGFATLWSRDVPLLDPSFGFA